MSVERFRFRRFSPHVASQLKSESLARALPNCDIIFQEFHFKELFEGPKGFRGPFIHRHVAPTC